jgi:hypothetical protein
LIENTRQRFRQVSAETDIFSKAKVTADSGFHSKAVLAAIEQTGVDVYIADRNYRRRDPAFVDAARHKERDRKERALKRRRERDNRPPQKRGLFNLDDFIYDEQTATCICPAGHKLYKSGSDMLFNGYRVAHFKAPITACRGCELRSQCLRYPERTPQRQLTVIKHREGQAPERRRRRLHTATERMRRKFDTPAGRAIYSKRMGTVEPVFANIQNKGMRRFTLRGRIKVNAQWQLFNMVHNIEKIAGAPRR